MRFNPKCTLCPRLTEYLGQMRQSHPHYHNAPVAAFGDPNPELLVVGLAPGAHGANATGRPFTGDFAGLLLYRALFAAGFSTAPQSHSGDDLRLTGCRITNAVKCLPPANKPTTAEADICNVYLKAELTALEPGSVIMALGTIAHRAVLKATGLKLSAYRFSHAAVHRLSEELTLVDSYHCSRYNTQTRRLTEDMFNAVLKKVRQLTLN